MDYEVNYGLVLAGGRSLRFGREKALAELDGLPLIARVHAVLANGCEQVAINTGAGTEAARFAIGLGLPQVPDMSGDPSGPLAGVKAGLAWAAANGATWLATAPCDTPLLPHDMVQRLIAGTGQENGAAVALTHAGLHPLCAIWRITRRNTVSDALTDGRHPSIKQVLTSLRARQLLFDSEDAFINVNTAEDYAWAERFISRAAPAGRSRL